MSKDRHFSHSGETDEDAAHERDYSDPIKEELLKELAEKWQAMSESNYDPNVVNAYLSALDKLDPMEKEFNAEKTSAAFREKYSLLFASVNAANSTEYPMQLGEKEKPEESNAVTKPHKVKGRFLVRRVAAVAIVAVFGSAFLAQSFGFDVFKLIASWTSDRFELSYGPRDESQQIWMGPITFDGVEEALTQLGIKEQVFPTWLPEGFELSGQVTVEAMPGHLILRANYTKEDNAINIRIIQYANAVDAQTGIYEKDNMDNVSPYEKNGIIHYIMSNYEIQKIVWVNETFLCSVSISEELNMDEITHMIDSIYDEG